MTRPRQADAHQTLISGRYNPGPPHRLNIFLVEQLADSFIRQVNAARFTAGYQWPCGQLRFRLSFLVNGRKLGHDVPCLFGTSRSFVEYDHTVLNVSWNWHARIIAGFPARVKNSTSLGTRRMNESERNIRMAVDLANAGQFFPGGRPLEVADRVSSPSCGDDGRTEDRGGASRHRVPRRNLRSRLLRLSLSAARKIGDPLYPAVLPDRKLIRARFEQYSAIPEDDR